MLRFDPMNYAILNLSGDNYLEWVMNASVTMKSRELERSIIQGDYEPRSEKLRAITIMSYHLTEEHKKSDTIG